MKKEHCSLHLQFTVNLADLKRSSRRLLTRMSDESESGGDFVVFNATGDGLQIVANRTSEGLVAIVSNAGAARIPYPVFRGIVRTFSEAQHFIREEGYAAVDMCHKLRGRCGVRWISAFPVQVTDKFLVTGKVPAAHYEICHHRSERRRNIGNTGE